MVFRARGQEEGCQSAKSELLSEGPNSGAYTFRNHFFLEEEEARGVDGGESKAVNDDATTELRQRVRFVGDLATLWGQV